MTVPTVVAGTLVRHADMPSQHIDPRHVDVWLPPGYAERPGQRYPVIYMHDGQNLFDGSHSGSGEDWGVVPAMERVMRERATPGAIVVGVWNQRRRWAQYMPGRPLAAPQAAALRERFIQDAGGPPESDAYLRFLAEELKPLIDRSYRARPEREQTFVIGSSMGGLISLYALCERPETFGGAACLSTHWVAGGELLVEGLAAELPPAGSHRLYFDYGTAGVDAPYEPFQRRFDGHMRSAGYREGADWLTLRFPGAEHNEAAWRERLHLPLAFLLAGGA